MSAQVSKPEGSRGAGPRPRPDWSARWGYLARTISLSPDEPVLLALSGGADSTYLLHVLAAARERPAHRAVHVDHGLRGAESDRDAAFCAALCRRLGVPFVLRRAELAPAGPSLEARARLARYRILAEEARRARLTAIVTGHHADDNLETLLMRWIRGTSLSGLAALRPRLELPPDDPEGGAGRPIAVYRPLFGLRREEVRELLASAGLEWCEDSSNRSPRFARNRVRHVLIPEIERIAGKAGVEHLRAFARAVEELERHLARATAELAWQPFPAVSACRSAGQEGLGGTLSRAALMVQPAALRRRALWRLVLEGTGRAPRRALLDALQRDLSAGRTARHSLPGGFALHLRPTLLELHPPPRLLDQELRRRRGQADLPFPEPECPVPLARRYLAFGDEHTAVLDFSGAVALSDGRELTLELVRGDSARDVPRGRREVELDPALATRPLAVRWPRAGDRFRPLGAPGSRPLRRVLADWGVPRDERARVPLVVAGGAAEEIVWVAGLCPAETARVRPPAPERVRLRLLRAAPEERPIEAGAEPPGAGQRGFFEAG